jgi:hypothetical protein
MGAACCTDSQGAAGVEQVPVQTTAEPVVTEAGNDPAAAPVVADAQPEPAAAAEPVTEPVVEAQPEPAPEAAPVDAGSCGEEVIATFENGKPLGLNFVQGESIVTSVAEGSQGATNGIQPGYLLLTMAGEQITPTNMTDVVQRQSQAYPCVFRKFKAEETGTFEPTTLGLSFKGDTVSRIQEGSQGHTKFVCNGWKVLKVGDKDAKGKSTDVFIPFVQELVKVGQPFTITFATTAHSRKW